MVNSGIHSWHCHAVLLSSGTFMSLGFSFQCKTCLNKKFAPTAGVRSAGNVLSELVNCSFSKRHNGTCLTGRVTDTLIGKFLLTKHETRE